MGIGAQIEAADKKVIDTKGLEAEAQEKLKSDQTVVEKLQGMPAPDMKEEIVKHLESEGKPGSTQFMEVFASSSLLDAELDMIEKGGAQVVSIESGFDAMISLEETTPEMLQAGQAVLTSRARAAMTASIADLNIKLEAHIEGTVQSAAIYYAQELAKSTAPSELVKNLATAKNPSLEVPCIPNGSEMARLNEITAQTYADRMAAQAAFQHELATMMKTRPEMIGLGTTAALRSHLQETVEKLQDNSVKAVDVQTLRTLHTTMAGQNMEELQIFQGFGTAIEKAIDRDMSEKVVSMQQKAAETIEIEDNKSKVEIQGVEIPNITESQATRLSRAAELVYNREAKPQSIEEINQLLEVLQSLNASELPQDAKYNTALQVSLKEMAFIQANTPLTIENGARDLSTGETTPIEIMPDENAAEMKRPTKNQLKFAEAEMMDTPRGRIMDMIAYLEDYKAVATDKFQWFHSMMPKDRLEELKSKTLPEAGQEKPNWQDVASQYEAQGNMAAAEQIRSTGRIEITQTVSGDIIVGEQHLRLVNDPEQQQLFDSVLDSLSAGDIVIVEHTSDPRFNAWATLSPEVRFMQQAELFPNNENGIGLEIMDTIGAPRWNTWEQSQQLTGVDRNRFQYTSGLLEASQRIMNQGGIEQLVSEIQQNTNLTEDDKKYALAGVNRFMQVLSAEPEVALEKVTKINRLRQLYLEIDAVARERVYQEKVAAIKAANPNSHIVTVVGASHRRGISATISDPEYRTDFDPTSIAEFNSELETI